MLLIFVVQGYFFSAFLGFWTEVLCGPRSPRFNVSVCLADFRCASLTDKDYSTAPISLFMLGEAPVQQNFLHSGVRFTNVSSTMQLLTVRFVGTDICPDTIYGERTFFRKKMFLKNGLGLTWQLSPMQGVSLFRMISVCLVVLVMGIVFFRHEEQCMKRCLDVLSALKRIALWVTRFQEARGMILLSYSF